MQGSASGGDGEWFVPMIVGDLREDRDKAGGDCVVCDCIFNDSMVDWTTKDIDFKKFVVELAVQRVEEKHSMVLDRSTLAFPNLRSKGPLNPRVVTIPKGPTASTSNSTGPKIEEVSNGAKSGIAPTWRWMEEDDHIRIIVDVPKLTRALHAQSTLDLEPRRLILRVGEVYHLDVALDALPRPVDIDRATAEWRMGAGQVLVMT